MHSHSHLFRPRLPLDPFAPRPWRVLTPSVPAPPPALLVIGDPDYDDLAPLAASSLLADGLLVIATATPPPLPTLLLGPSIIVLRLPRSVHDADAPFLLSVLSRATRAAHAWRSAPLAQPRLQQLAELFPGGDFTVRESPQLAPVGTRRPLSYDTDDTRSTRSFSSPSSTSSLTRPRPRTSSRCDRSDSTAIDIPQFSALLNFLPSTLPEKALLKHAILLTTLAGSFLASPHALPTRLFASGALKPRRSSLFSSLPATRSRPRLNHRFPSLVSGRSSPSSVKSHPKIVHVLPRPKHRPPFDPGVPAPKTRLVQSMEQFLLSFAYPPSPSPRSSVVLGPPSTSPQLTERATPFLVPTGVLGSYPSRGPGPICVGELLVLGALDDVASGGVAPGLSDSDVADAWPRAWIGCAADVEVVVLRAREEDSPVSLPKDVHLNASLSRRGGVVGVGLAGLPTPPDSGSSLEGSVRSASMEGTSSSEGSPEWSVEENERGGMQDGAFPRGFKVLEKEGERGGRKQKDKAVSTLARLRRVFLAPSRVDV